MNLISCYTIYCTQISTMAPTTRNRSTSRSTSSRSGNRSNTNAPAALTGRTTNRNADRNANRNADRNANRNDNNNDDAEHNMANDNDNEEDPYDKEPPYEVWMGILACGIDDVALAKRLSKNLFMDDYERAFDVKTEDVNAAFKTLERQSEATRVNIEPYMKNHIHAFHHWIKIQIWSNLLVEYQKFPINKAPIILRQAERHNQYLNDADSHRTSAKPKPFTKDDEWDDWSKSFYAYVKLLPGTNGLPLCYVIREDDEPDNSKAQANGTTMDDFIMLAPLTGIAFKDDSLKVHTLLIQFIIKNPDAMSIVKSLGDTTCGRSDWKALVSHYQGQGVYTVHVMRAEKVIKDLIYTGEKKPSMWWGEFQRQLNTAFATINADENRVMYSEKQKLRILLEKIQYDRLSNVKSNIIIEMSRDKLNYTYDEAMRAFKNEVMMIEKTHPTRIMKSVDSKAISKGNKNGNKKQRPPHPDAITITLMNGKKIKYHASHNFDNETYAQFTQEQKKMLRDQRKAYKLSRTRGQHGNDNLDSQPTSHIQSLQRQIEEIRTVAKLQRDLDEVRSTVSFNTIPSQVPDSRNIAAMSRSPTSHSRGRGTIMGGRKEQEYIRHGNSRNYSRSRSRSP